MNNHDIKDITNSLNDLSIQSPGNLDIASLVQSTDETDNPTVQHNILPTVKSKIVVYKMRVLAHSASWIFWTWGY